MRSMNVKGLFWQSVLPVLITLCVFLCSVFTLGSAQSLPANDRSFVWKTETEFGGFDFTLGQDLTHISHLSVRLERYSCGGLTVTGDINVESRDIWPIVDDRFEIDTNLGVYRIIICGIFDNAHLHVHGTWEILFAGTTCSGNWWASGE